MSEHDEGPADPIDATAAESDTTVHPAGSDTTVYAASGSRTGRYIVGGVLALTVATMGAIYAFSSSTGSDPAAARVPRSAELFVQVTVEPSIEQQRAVRALADRLPGGRGKAEELVDQGLRSFFDGAPGGLKYEDVQPWLGAQIAVVVPNLSTPERGAVILVQSDDDAKASETIARLQASEVATDLDGGWVYLAQRPADIKAVQEDAADDPLMRDRLFRNQREKVGGDGILLARIDAAGLATGAQGFLGIGPQGTGSQQPGVLSVRLADEGVVLTAIGPAAQDPGAGTPALMDAAPASTSAAFSLFDLASTIRAALPQIEEQAGMDIAKTLEGFGVNLETDLLSWLGGEVTVLVGSPQANEFALAIEASDADAMARAVDQIRGFAALAGAASEDFKIAGGPDDFILTIEGNRVRVVQRDGTLFVASSPTYMDRLLAPASALIDDAVYSRLLPGTDAVTAQGFVAFQRLLPLVPSEARGFFEIFDGLAMRARYESGDAIFTLTMAYAA